VNIAEPAANVAAAIDPLMKDILRGENERGKINLLV